MPIARGLRCSFLLWFALAPAAGGADEFTPGQSYFGRQRYIEYIAGNLPVVLSAPHGGRMKPEEIPDRAEGTFAFDSNTQELARAVAAELRARTGGWPHVVVCRLSRRKIDCNRELQEAAAGNRLAEQAWHEFQGYLDTARATVTKQQGRGLYIDLHGHGHAEQRLELGYLHSATRLDADDETLNSASYVQESGLRAIAALGRLPYAQLVRGEQSFGALLEKQGFLCSPSPSNPRPKAPYFRGGYNTARHGREAAPLAGMQIETYSRGVRDTRESRAKFARALASALETYLPMHLGVGLVAREALGATREAQQLEPASVK